MVAVLCHAGNYPGILGGGIHMSGNDYPPNLVAFL